MDRFRIAVVGAGETGAPLLEQLFAAAFVDVVGVADLDLDSPGARQAKARGVLVTKDFMELARLGDKIDILIDVTGAPKVREALRNHMAETSNHHTIIMHETIALLMLSLSAGRLVTSKHGDQDYD